jgi:hypothetical protein
VFVEYARRGNISHVKPNVGGIFLVGITVRENVFNRVHHAGRIVAMCVLMHVVGRNVEPNASNVENLVNGHVLTNNVSVCVARNVNENLVIYNVSSLYLVVTAVQVTVGNLASVYAPNAMLRYISRYMRHLGQR